MLDDRLAGPWHESLESAVRRNSHAAFGEGPTEKGCSQYLAGGLLYSEGRGRQRCRPLPRRIEIAIIGRECLRRRAGDRASLERQVAALEAERNEQRRTITWSFTAYDARQKLRRLYPRPQN
ncbi:MAG: hypothetical protein M3Z66_18295 [Chloroflexota bacterium]|nr:hypothetical protein [Chloroflexota bacterium]